MTMMILGMLMLLSGVLVSGEIPVTGRDMIDALLHTTGGNYMRVGGDPPFSSIHNASDSKLDTISVCRNLDGGYCSMVKIADKVFKLVPFDGNVTEYVDCEWNDCSLLVVDMYPQDAQPFQVTADTSATHQDIRNAIRGKELIDKISRLTGGQPFRYQFTTFESIADPDIHKLQYCMTDMPTKGIEFCVMVKDPATGVYYYKADTTYSYPENTPKYYVNCAWETPGKIGIDPQDHIKELQ
jgi:hypothetical protein